MKKGIRIFVVALLVCALSVGLLAACKEGKSAYQIAVDNGFVGSEQEWLESLKGDSIDIYDLYEAYLEVNENATFAQFLQQFLVVDYYDTEYAAAKGLLSSVSVYCTFTRRNTAQGQSSEYGSAGSGVIYKIVDGYAYIITNYHVVYDRDSSATNRIAHTIEVYSYGFEFLDLEAGAQFVGGSITKDIAIIRALVSAFPTTVVEAELGNSNTVALGERVVAVGNPLADGISVTTGVISVDSQDIEMEALDNSNNSISMRVMRTDTAINSGNSGGGLFNIMGELVGIINAKTVEDGIEGMGYAIPISVAKGIADSVIEGFNKKCLLGVMAVAVTNATVYNSDTNRVEIYEQIKVQSTSSSLTNGKLLADDILLSIAINEGEQYSLTRIFHLSDYLYKVREGDKLYIEVSRNGEILTIELIPSASDFTVL